MGVTILHHGGKGAFVKNLPGEVLSTLYFFIYKASSQEEVYGIDESNQV